MIGTEEQTSPLVRSAYRFAVKASLTRFYGKTEAEAETLVQSWWNRVLSLDPTTQDFFLHQEAIITGADLAKAPEVPITSENQAAYAAILEESERQAGRTEFQKSGGTVASERKVENLMDQPGGASPVAPASSGKVRGAVKWFNKATGFGFLEQEGKPDVFVHYNSIYFEGYKSLKEGDEVEFDLIQGTKGWEALNVRPTTRPRKLN